MAESPGLNKDDTRYGPTPVPATGGSATFWQPPAVGELQEVLPAYHILSLLGRGGMGAVYKAEQIALERPVAIKVMSPVLHSSENSDFAARFRREARTLAKLTHPGIVQVYDSGQTSTGLLYFVMEYVDGTDVQRMIQDHGPLPERDALAIAAHVCEALEYAHGCQVIHRDIKPANILVSKAGQVKMGDFGLAKMLQGSGEVTLTAANVIMGSPHFLAPEALQANVELDGRADIYGLGVMLYTMLTGHLPAGMFELPSRRGGGDVRCDRIVARAMQPQPEKRYASAAEMRADLEEIFASHRLESTGAKPPAAPRTPRAALVGGLLVATVLGLAGLAMRGRDPGSPEPVAEPPPSEAAPALPALGASPVAQPVPPAAAPPLVNAAMPEAAPPAPTYGRAANGQFGGHSYVFVRERNCNWHAAQRQAQAMGGYLACITSEEENRWMMSTFGGHASVKSQSFFLGGIKPSASESWQWVSGEPFVYQDWHHGQPNADFTPVILHLSARMDSRGEEYPHWNDANLDADGNGRGFLVEIEPAQPK